MPCFRHVLYCLVPKNVQLHSCHKYIACARNHPCPGTNSVLQKILTHAQAIWAQKACAQDLQCSSKLVLQTTLAHTSFLSSESLCFEAPWPAHKFFELGKLVLQSTLAHAQPFWAQKACASDDPAPRTSLLGSESLWTLAHAQARCAHKPNQPDRMQKMKKSDFWWLQGPWCPGNWEPKTSISLPSDPHPEMPERENIVVWWSV